MATKQDDEQNKRKPAFKSDLDPDDRAQRLASFAEAHNVNVSVTNPAH